MNIRLTVAAAAATVLASIALYPLLQTGGWFWAGAGAVIVVAAVGAVTRRRTIPALVCLLAAVAGEFLYLNALFAGRQSWAGLVPNGASLHHLRELVMQATAETSKLGPPVPARPGVVLVTVAGIGFVGALTDVLAVRLHRPALAGLPLLVLFCVPLTTAARPSALGGILVFCAGMAGYLGLLSADGRHRLRLWGRLIHPWQDEPGDAGPDIRPLAAAGRRIGSAAVVLALFLPLLVPGLREHKLFSGSGTGTGTGTGPGYHGHVFFPDPLVEMNQELHEARPQAVLTYHTTDASPPYLQVYVLNRLTPSAWTLTQPTSSTSLRSGRMPNAPGLLPTTLGPTVHEEIDLSRSLTSSGSNSVSYLPLPYPARQVSVGGNWRVDASSMTVLATGVRLAGLQYSVTSKDVNPSAGQLRDAAPPPPAITGDDEYVPPAFDGLRRLAHQITAGRTSSYGRAVALQEWFTRPGNFKYSLNVPPINGADALKQFLTTGKTGYCQQFAFAMAVLARLLHIPARVVVGYTQGTVVGTDTWQVKTSDAHAWPELYFAGAGWLRFEPTPGADAVAGQATAFPPPYSLPPSLGRTSPQPGVTSPRTSRAATNHSRTSKQILGKLNGDANRGSLGGGRRHASSTPFAALAIALLVVLLITPGTIRVVRRRLRWWRAADDVARAHAAWRELCDDLTDYRIPFRASESPRSLVHRLTKSLSFSDAERAALERVALAEERATYASSPADSAPLRADAALVRRAIAGSSAVSARWSARLAPSSALIPLRASVQHLLDVFGWMELAAAKARNRAALRRENPAHS